MMGVVSIVIPAYNEAKRITVLLSDLQKVHLVYGGFLQEVIIVDDGSRDATVERAMVYAQRLPLRVIRMRENGGKWSAIRVGLRECRGTIVCVMDADASVLLSEEMRIFGDTPEQWKRFAEELRERRKVVVGSRFHRDSIVEGKSMVRRVVSMGYRVFVRAAYRYATGKSAPGDMQCPFKIFHASLLEGLEKMTVKRFAGDIELLFVMNPRECVDVPVHFVHRRGGSVRPSTAMEMFRETVRLAKKQKYMNKLIQR